MIKNLRKILSEFKSNNISLEEVFSYISSINESTLLEGEVRIDNSRSSRCCFPEFIYGSNKTDEQLINIINSSYKEDKVILVTRINQTVYKNISTSIPENIKFEEKANALYYLNCDTLTKIKNSNLKAGVITAGSSDMSVALEAKLTIEASGFPAEIIMDIGVAGIHRLFNKLDKIKTFDVLIIAAGMEGALPSVVGGLVSCPVIAVPTSVGYGSSFNGITALLAMLNSCANGISVVNIDSGFGAGCAAARHLNAIKKATTVKN